MVSISFIYKMKNINKTFYGKYISDYISDDHDGLDIYIKYEVLNIINKYRENQNLKKISKKNIMIGIISCSNENYLDYSTDNEIFCFDFYHIEYKGEHKYYINGKKIA